MNILKSKTFWGSLISAAAVAFAKPTPDGIAQAVGIVLAGVGVRQAIAKNGSGQ